MIKKFIVFTCLLLPFSLHAKTILHGAGATFPYPLYLKMIEVYKKETGIEINYQPIGSGGGIRNIVSGIVDFAGSDVFLSDEEERESGVEILHIPTVIGSVVLAYNLPGIQDIILDSTIIEKIYTGEITHWNDAAIAALNPQSKLPHLRIIPVYRADGSGTTFVFTDYLSHVSRDWKEIYGAEKSIAWDVGVGQKGNAGVAGYIKTTKGAIGYIELGYAEQSLLPFASIRNASGKLITSKNIIEATSQTSRGDMPSNLKVSLVNSHIENAAPIATFTWILVRKEQSYNKRSYEQAKATKEFLTWLLTSGQALAQPLSYAPLSDVVQKKALDMLDSLTYQGKKIQ